MEYKIGQILTSQEEKIVEKALSGEKVTIKKGDKVIIGADNMAHHISTGMIQHLGENAEVKGYDTKGLAQYLYSHLCNYCPLKEILDDYGIEENVFEKEIEFALDEIGF